MRHEKTKHQAKASVKPFPGSPEATLSTDELEQRVLGPWAAEDTSQLLSKLSGVQRKAITLAYFGKYTCRQVAALIYEREDTVTDAINAGLRGLQAAAKAQSSGRSTEQRSIEVGEMFRNLPTTMSPKSRTERGGVSHPRGRPITSQPIALNMNHQQPKGNIHGKQR
jgi:hypothetical protein